MVAAIRLSFVYITGGWWPCEIPRVSSSSTKFHKQLHRCQRSSLFSLSFSYMSLEGKVLSMHINEAGDSRTKRDLVLDLVSSALDFSCFLSVLFGLLGKMDK